MPYGTTAIYGLRKLLGTSLARDIDAGFDALAEDVEDALNIPTLSAYVSAAQDVVDNEDIVFDAVEWDIGSYYDNTTGEYLPDIAGFYRVSIFVAAGEAVAVDKKWGARLDKDGIPLGLGFIPSRSASTPHPVFTCSILIQLDGTEPLKIQADHDVGAAVDLAGGGLGGASLACRFQVELIARL